MEIALSIALLIGTLLFIIGLLIVVWAGFKHHFFTGIIAIFPFLNVIILPSVWHRAYLGVYIGIIGALLTLGAWYGGGNQHLTSEAAKLGVSFPISTKESNPRQSELTEDEDTATQKEVDSKKVLKTNKAQPIEQPYIPEGDIHKLPPQALYTLSFNTVELSSLSRLKGEYVRIEQRNGKITEGKVTKSQTSSILIESNNYSENIILEIKASDIQKIEKLVQGTSK